MRSFTMWGRNLVVSEGGTDCSKGDMEDEFSEVTGRILKAAFRVQNTLGCGFLKKVYENAMCVALGADGLGVDQETPIHVHFDGMLVVECYSNRIVEGQGLVELKATREDHPIHVAQVLNYVKATNLPVGMLLNFGDTKLRYRRSLR